MVWGRGRANRKMPNIIEGKWTNQMVCFVGRLLLSASKPGLTGDGGGPFPLSLPPYQARLLQQLENNLIALFLLDDATLQGRQQ